MPIQESQTQDCIAVDQDADHDELVTAVLKLAEENRQLRTRFGELEDNHADLKQEHADLRDDHADLREEHADLKQEHVDLREEHADLKQEHVDLREEHADLKQEHAKQAARLDTLEQQNTEQAARIDDLEQQLQQEQDLRGQQVAETRKDLAQLHDTVDQLQQQSEPPTIQTEHPAQPHSPTPIEQLSQGDRQDIAADVTPSVERALTLFEHLPDWGTKTPKGLTLTPDNRPKDLLEAATGESLAWQQYYRACEAVESLSKGAVTFVDTNRHGKTLVLHDDTDVHTRATTSKHSDSRPSLVAD